MRPRGALLKPTNIPAIIALIVMLIATWYVAGQNQVLYEQRLRSDVLKELSLIRAKLEGNINGNLQLVRGLIATIATEPQMDQARFSALAGKIFEEDSQLRNVAAAPDLVVRLMYPLAGNEKAIGLDYRENAAQRDGALRARDTGELVLAGPVDLVQGGRGFVGRFPVFIGGSDGEPRRFWGIVSAVVDARRLYIESGLSTPELGLDIAISGRDGSGPLGGQFFGPESVLADNPVTADVILPAGVWQIAAVPKGGWVLTPPDAWQLWLAFALLAAIVTVPILVAGRLLEERQHNVRALRSRETELQRLSRRLGLALETSEVGVFEYDLETGELVWDDRVNAIFGLPQDGGARGYSDWRNALHPDDLKRAEEEFRVAVEETGRYHSEYRVVSRSGETRNIRAIGSVYKDLSITTKIVGVNWDVSADVALNEKLMRANRLTEARNVELEAAKARIEHNALHDSLTGLPNQRYLDEKLQAQHDSVDGTSLSLLHIDLDRFKQINDTLGHAAGDAMLIHAAEVLKSNVRTDDFVARIGGDEFVVLSFGSGEDAALADLAERIIARMRQPVPYEGHECRFGVSVGIASESGNRLDPRRLLINADIALYKAKSRGRNRHEFFTEALEAEVINTKRRADEILFGLEHNAFEPYFQPQFDAHTLDIVGAEALARWHHPTEGLLAPAQFLDVAEELSVVSTIDRMILEETLTRFDQWQAMGLGVPRVSVNVSARRLQDEQLIASLRGLRIRPGTVSFELVESIFLDETDDNVLFNIDQIKDLGIDIEIDDFGTGYASIVSLLKLKPRRLKIDRQLVMPIVESPAQRHLAESIIEIGRSLGIEVVGEGVETMEHAAILRDIGCDILQGYAFAEAMPADRFAAFVKASEWRRLAPAAPKTRVRRRAEA